MKAITHRFTALLLLTVPAFVRAAPVELGRESFEAAPGIGYTTSTLEFDDPFLPNSDFFGRFPNDGARTRGVISGGDGSSVFMGEDLDQVAPVGPTQFLTTNAFSIAGKINTSVKILLAAPGTGPSGTVANGGHQNHYDHDVTVANVDFVRVEASVDGGPFNRLIMFSPNTNTLNQPLSLDADGDYLGGGVPTLNSTFQEFDLPIPTGNSVQVRVVMHTNATNEYILVDNIRIFGETSATAAPVLAGVPGTTLTFVEGGAAQQLAPAITVTDADSANIASATISIPAGYVNGEDVLSATPSGAILAGDIVFAPATGTLTITRSASKATWETVLRSVSYRNTNTSGPNTGARQVQFRVSDGTNPSNQPIRTVQVTDALVTQNVPFTESFETDGRGSRYALDGRFTASATSYFDRQTTVAGVTNLDGTSAIVAEDTETNPSPVKSVNILCNGTGFTTLYATVRLGAPGGSVYDAGELLAVEYSAGGLAGPWQTAGIFRSTGVLNFPMALDTNGDGIGDGLQLSAAMKDFTFILPAATTFGFRVRCASNSAGERLIVDKIALSGINTPSDLAAFWNFDTPITNGLAVDSRAGLAARVLGGAAQTPDGEGRSGLAGDRAMRFGTGAQRLHVPAPDGGYFTGVAAADKMSVTFWIRQNVRNATPFSIVAPSSTFTRGFQAHTPWSEETIYFDTAGCCGATDTRTQFTTSGVTWPAWHHVALVKNGAVKMIYLDGNLLTTGNNTNTLAIAFTELFLGNAPNQSEAVDGDMDDVAFYGNALSAGEVALLAALQGSLLQVTANDTDGDTMPDKWERRFAPNLTTLTSATADNDGDGTTNAEEFALGRNPLAEEALLVTTAADGVPGSLRAQLAAAAAQAGPDTVRFDPAVFNGEPGDTIVLSSEILIEDTAPVSINANHRTGGVLIDAGTGTNRHFRIGPGTTASITRLSLFGGNGTGTGFVANYGGAIFNDGTLTLTECLLSGNSTFAGGAIFNPGPASLNIVRSTISGNSASYGGAIQHESPALLTLTACTLANNTATTEGGAINAPFARPITLVRCTVTGNAVTSTGGAGGGGINSNATGNFQVRDSIVSGNTDANSPGTPNLSPYSSQGVNHTGAVADVRLAPLGDYGGPTPTFALRPGSIARNNSPTSTLTADQRGFALVGAPDIGAYEAGTFSNYNAWIWETLPITATAPQTAPGFDFDNDGASNETEWLSLTDPTNANSALRPAVTRSGGNVIISFPSVTGRSYRLLRSDTMAPGSWTDTGLAVITGNGATRTFTITLPAVQRRFFQVAPCIP